MRIVGSLTTLPGRKHLYATLKSLLNQTLPLDKIYVNVPYKTLKGKIYDEEYLEKLSYLPTVCINRCTEDYGPITKLVPTLYQETDDDTMIITFDDDIHYLPKVVQRLVYYSKRDPNSCYAFSGVCSGFFPFYFQWVINNQDLVLVDWIQGVHGVVYRRKFFDIQELLEFRYATPHPNDFLWNDDHAISTYLASKGIDRFSIGGSRQNMREFTSNNSTDALSSRRIPWYLEHIRIIKYSREIGLYGQHYNIFSSLVLMIVMFLLIFIVGFLKWRNPFLVFTYLYALKCHLFLNNIS